MERSLMVTVQCPCGYRMSAEIAHLGQNAQCAHCGQTFLLWPAEETQAPAAADAMWHLRVGETEFGPFPPTELVRFVVEGRIRTGSLVRKGPTGPWTPAEHVRGLLDAPSRRALPPRPTAQAAAPAAVARPRAASETARPPQRGGKKPARKGRPASRSGALFAMAGGLCVIVVLAAVLLSRRGSGGAPEKEKKPAAPPVAKVDVPKPAPPPAPAAPAAPKALTPQELVAKASPAVAVLQGRSGTGSGFLVDKGLLATNRHVVADELVDQVRALWPDGGKSYEGSYGVRLVYEDPDVDVALLAVDVELAPLKLSGDDAVVRGQEIMCIGSPGMTGSTLANAIGKGLLGTSTTIGGQAYHQLDLAVNPGNSGGPVFNMNGYVIGVVTLKAARLDGVGFCLPGAVLRHCLERSKSLSDVERAGMIAKHRLRVCAAALIQSAKCYAAAGDLYVDAMEASVAAKENLNVGLRKARDAADGLLRRINGNLTFVVREHCEKPTKDAALSSVTREKYTDLLAVYRGIKEHVEYPSGTLASFKTDQQAFATRLRKLVAHFVIAEGVEAEED
jgi:serine protease Do